MTVLALLGILLVGYLLGAVPFGYLIARARGVDIFAQGSGNIGATNVGRILGRKFGILVFVLDFLKGALPTLGAALLSAQLQPDLPADLFPVCAGVAAILGHSFPVYLRFRGGKGVATGAGVVTVLLPGLLLLALLAWLVVVSASRMVSLASLAAALVLCTLRFLLTPAPLETNHLVLSLFCVATTLLVFARHQGNIRRLLAGTENQLKDSAKMFTLTKTLHVLAVGLWFGMGLFFTFVVGLQLFATLEAESLPTNRPYYYPLPAELTRDRPSERFPDPLRKEQGSRLAGIAISPMFTWYYALQAGCSLVAVITAWNWVRYPGKVHTLRRGILVVALLTVALGWWMEWKVHELRGPRNDLSDAVLTSKQPPSAEPLQKANEARADFGRWHGYSVMVNLLTLILVTGAMALAAQLPAHSPGEPPPTKPQLASETREKQTV